MKNTIMIFIYVIPIVLAIVYALLYLLNKVKASKIYLIIISVIIVSLTVSILIIPSCGSTGMKAPNKPLPAPSPWGNQSASERSYFEDQVRNYSYNHPEINNKYIDNSGFIAFGEYPQSLVTDKNIIEALNKMSSSQEDRNGYYNYSGYYYAPAKAITDGYFKNANVEMVKGELYWFRVEPIKWFPIYNDQEKVLIVSDIILGGSVFKEMTENPEHNYNDYSYSDVINYLLNLSLKIFDDDELDNIISKSFKNYPVAIDFLWLMDQVELGRLTDNYSYWYPITTDYDIARYGELTAIWTRICGESNDTIVTLHNDDTMVQSLTHEFWGVCPALYLNLQYEEPSAE